MTYARIPGDVRAILRGIGVDPDSITVLPDTPRDAPDLRVPRARLEELGWPARALDEASRADVDRAAISALRDRGPDAEGIVVLSGVPGNGKTVAAAWQAAERERGTVFVRASVFARTSRYGGGYDGGDARRGWLDAARLCLDDLGSEYVDAKGSFSVDLDELIDTFYADRRRLTITTNCTAAAFRERYGARVVDRLAECGEWIRVDDPSFRNPR